MKLRKGINNIISEQIRQGNYYWLATQSLKYFRIRLSLSLRSGVALAGPIAAHLFITTRCNLKCPMCLIPQKKRGPEMDTREASSLIKELSEMGTSGICFTGGEPLMRKDIFELISLCRSLNIPTVLVTNGLLLEERLEELLQAQPTTVNVSVDGSRPEIHDRSHAGKNVFERMTRGVRFLSNALKKKGDSSTTITISSVIQRNNCDDIDNIISLSKNLGADRIVFLPLHHNRDRWCGVEEDPQMPPVSRHLREHPSREFIENSDIFLGALDRLFEGKGFPLRCTAGPTTIIVGPDRRIYPCKGFFEIEKAAFDPRAEGKSLKDIWYGEQYRELRREASDCNMCAFPCNREFDPLFTRKPAVPFKGNRARQN